MSDLLIIVIGAAVSLLLVAVGFFFVRLFDQGES